jgi:hypothetical protein
MFRINMWNADVATISPEDLLRVLSRKGLTDLSARRVSWVMQQIGGGDASTAQARVQGEPFEFGAEGKGTVGITFKTFMSAMFSNDMGEGLDTDAAEEVMRWRGALRTQTMSEVIDGLAKEVSPEDVAPKGGTGATPQNRRQSTISVEIRRLRLQIRGISHTRVMHVLNTIVGFTVAASFLVSTLSIDYCVGCNVWLYFEVLIAVIFIAEVMIKLQLFGYKEYWFGVDWKWNWCDTLVTFVQVLDVALTVSGAQTGQSTSSFLIMVRTLRILRVARLVKLMGHPVLDDLGSMLSGLLLGLPALLWVSVLLSTILWMIAFGLRSVIGPQPGKELLIDTCGGFDGDSLLNASVVEDIPECADTYRLYAEEYCPTVLGCSYMVFRCMIGDCSSKGGQSLPGHLAYGYGWRFMLTYCLGMLFLVFGLFNVITAIFVDSTMKGVAAENLWVKRVNKYNAKHMKRSLHKLVARIMTISANSKKATHPLAKSTTMGLVSAQVGKTITGILSIGEDQEHGDSDSVVNSSSLMISEGAFTMLLKDEAVQKIFDELDINLGADDAGIFQSLKKDGNGQVRLPDLLDTLIKLRGDASKADLVMPSVMADSLSEEIHEVQETLASHHRAIFRAQQERDRLRREVAQARDEAASRVTVFAR